MKTINTLVAKFNRLQKCVSVPSWQAAHKFGAFPNKQAEGCLP